MGSVGARAAVPWLRPGAAPLLLAAALAWVAVVWLARGLTSMTPTMGLGPPAFLAVWTLMMAAMMLPAVSPVAGLYTRTFSGGRGRRSVEFAAGYLMIWAAAGLPAFAAALGAHALAAGHPTLARLAAAGVFLLFAVYQLTPLKRLCLKHCRSPLAHLVQYAGFRGPLRDLRVGAHHGAYCLGCCWPLMLLLVALGTMNLLVMVLLAAYVLLEKHWSWGIGLSRLAAAAAVVLGAAVFLYPQLAPGLTSM